MSRSPSRRVQVIPPAEDLPLLSQPRRETRRIRLANGFSGILVHDPEIDKSGIAVSVESGQWSDPLEHAGTAHFLEHLLGMGSKAFPEEDTLRQYVGQYSGSKNAATSTAWTYYMAELNHEGFPGYVERFAPTFIEPLFNPSGIARELNAVDQEHAKNHINDARREYFVFKEAGNPDHPNIKFSTGNAETLGKISTETVHEWFRANYTPERMHFCTVSTLSLDEQQDLVVKHFRRLKRRTASPPDLSMRITRASYDAHWFHIKPFKERRKLELRWELPQRFLHAKDEQPGRLLSYVLGDEGKESLTEYLKQAGWAEALGAGGYEPGNAHHLFKLSITLTKQGVKHVNDVVKACFSAIAAVKGSGLPEHVYKDSVELDKLMYQFQSRHSAFGLVSSTVVGLIREPIETYPFQTLYVHKWDRALAMEYLSLLTPAACQYTLIAPPEESGVQPTITEKYIGTEYSIAAVAPALLADWAATKPYPELGVPPANEFIPKDLTLKVPVDPKPPLWPKPSILIDTPSCKMFYAPDVRYGVPKARFIFKLQTPALVQGDARNAVLADLWARSAREQLNPLLYRASTAAVYANVSTTATAVYLSLHGFVDKMPVLLRKVVESIKKVEPVDKLFLVYRDALKRRYKNRAKDQPYSQGMEQLNRVYFPRAVVSAEKLAVVDSIKRADLLAFGASLFAKTYTEGLVYGNLTAATVKEMSETLRSSVGSAPYPEHDRRQVPISSVAGPVSAPMTLTEVAEHSAVLVMPWGRADAKLKALTKVTAAAVKASFFQELRTNQQTGYLVWSFAREVEGHIFFYFIVQSKNYAPGDLLQRYEVFIRDFVATLADETKFPASKFDTYRKSAITTLTTPLNNLDETAEELYNLAFKHDGDFERLANVVSKLEALSFAEWKEFVTQRFVSSNPNRLAVLIRGTKEPAKWSANNPVSYKAVADVDALRAITQPSK